jgi:phenylacetate-CoA ligase
MFGPVMSAATTVELSVIVPCLNEEGNVPELVARVLGVFAVGGLAGELVLVDDGSTDQTARRIREAMARAPGRVRGCFHAHNRGIAAAWRSGLEASTGRLCALIDADLQYQPEDLLRLHRALYEHNVDIVQGWRSAVGRAKGPRYYYSRGFNWLLNGVFSMKLADNKSGFVMCAREVLADLLSYRGRYFYWQSFIMVAARAKGYSARQLETLFEERKQGRSFLDGHALGASAKSLVDLSRAAWEYRLARRPADVAQALLRRRPIARPREPRPLAAEARWRAYLGLFERSHWMLTRDVEHYYETLQRTQWLDRAALAELQDDKLRRLVRHCYRNVPYYREQMRARGLRPEDIRTRADLPKLGFVTKEDIRRHLYFDIMSDDHDKAEVLKVTTSGSTGEPFVCYVDRRQLELRWAATLRAQEWTGYRFGDPCVRLWHQTLGLSRTQAVRERLDAWLSNRHFVPVFELGDAGLEATVRLIERLGPTLVDGYAEALDFIAHQLRSASPGRLAGRVGAVMSSAQTLPDASRRLIEQAFGCRVFDKYGSREFSGIAYECEAHAGHHVVAEGYIVELLREGRPAVPGEIGEVVITDLTNYCMPFVRYRIGDLAVAMGDEPCRCGRGAPRIGQIEGRVQSIIQGSDGRYLPGTFFSHYFKDLSHAIRRYRVVQERRGAIRLELCKAGRFSEAVLEEVLATLRAHLGQGTEIEVAVRDDIALTGTGKHLGSVSHLPVDLQAEHAPVIVRPGGNGQ